MTSHSFLRWAGSKQKLIPRLKSYWGSGFDRYVEPFMGSAQLFFSISPECSLLSDLNKELIEVFYQIQKNPYPVYQIASSWEISKRQYYRIRSIDPATLGINQRAARFLYLNKLCFNGLYRTNLSGAFNVPYSGQKPDYICDYQFLKSISKKLENATIVQGDFETIIFEHARPGDFVYLDPPYAVQNRRIFKQYGPQTFGLQDLERLREVLHYLNCINAKFLLSYAYCKEAISIFDDWQVQKTFTQRNISGFAEFRKTAAEVLITNI
ncbi:MAG: Dam family site-specific DNA-(adenine-N6)-methyltransferase [Chitinophagaceae bacterium]|nr:MAG: Dam family site-specific DNA-(adenine-N6)-methyltransferase [Chitinophagaceae bacterium]